MLIDLGEVNGLVTNLLTYLLTYLNYLLTYLPTCLLAYFTYSLTHVLEKSPSWEANRFSVRREIPRILWNPKVDYPVYKSYEDPS